MPQVTILEGGKPKSFAGVDKLQIALSGGGTSLWVPKDTRLLTALTANVNGTYPPPEGYFGFDTVIVNVPPSQVAGIDPETGQYVLVGTKKTKPEDPKWPTTPDDPYDPDNPNGYGWDPWEDTDPWDKDPYKDDWDEDENELTEEEIPYGIKIIQPPTKTQYTVGETIDYSGIQVQLVDVDGNLFTNSRYPNGLVPFSELSFDPTKAPQGGTFDYYTNGAGVIAKRIDFTFPHFITQMVHINLYAAIGTSSPIGMYEGQQVYAGGSWVTEDSDHIDYIYVTKYNNQVYGMGNKGGIVQPYSYSTEKGRYISLVTGNSGVGTEVFTHLGWENYFNNVPTSSVDPTGVEESSLVSMGFEATVTWNNTYGMDNFSDSMSLQLIQGGDSDDSGNTSDPEGGGGGFSGGGGEGIGGEGGGGGF